jgi:alpha,alpha-trehalase
MKASSPVVHIASRDVDAVLFDLDGVVTQTVKLHAAAWKELFDGYLRQRAALEHKTFQPFDPETDYRRYVDGKPRYAGVESFLKSRRLELPYGDPSDSPQRETVCGLGNKKDGIFLELLKTEGVEVFDSAVALTRALKARGIKTAIVSSSKNCAAVLDAAGLAELFAARVDGVDVAHLKLRGKPDPDIYLKAAEPLGVAPARAVVVEDAIAGVQAGRNGNFGLVIGVARQGNHTVLQENGADAVVSDLREVEAIVDDVLAGYSMLHKGYGKKVFDLQPRLDWHKGHAVMWVLRALRLDGSDVLPLYIGDDLTDENAFRVLVERGISIVVAESSRPTAASYVLKNPHEVLLFLRRLIAWLDR